MTYTRLNHQIMFWLIKNDKTKTWLAKRLGISRESLWRRMAKRTKWRELELIVLKQILKGDCHDDKSI